MPEKPQEPMNLPPPTVPIGVPELSDTNIDHEDERARQELARITPSNAVLLEWVKKNPPPPEYFEGDEGMPFEPIED